MNITKAGGITCSFEPLRLLILSSPSFFSRTRVKSVEKSGNGLQLHHRTVHYFSHHQLYHPSFKHCRLKQLSSKQQQQQTPPPFLPLQIKQTSNLHTDGNKQLRRPSANNIILGNRIKEALANRSPIVALESTVITHGLPEPENLRLALSLEERIAKCTIKREETTKTNIGPKSNFQSLHSSGWSENELANKVTPATVGIVKGQIIVGLSNDEIEYLATKSRSNPIKASRRDISIATALGLSAGTTVSATMAIASSVIRPISMKLAGNTNPVNYRSALSHLSAIKVFATGGTGGVHMGGESSLDISADLFEFAKSPIGVVSSGFKSFLDTRRSLEYLETMGCTVISLRSDNDYNSRYSDEDDSSSLSDSSDAWLSKQDDKSTIGLNERQQSVNSGSVRHEHAHKVVVDGSEWLNNKHYHEYASTEMAEALKQQEEEETLFPGFYSRINSQNVKSPHVVKSIEEAGRVLFQCLEAPLLDRRGFLLAVPIPKMFSLDSERMATLLAKISSEIDLRSDIEGREKTPMLLERFSRETRGASLRANMELLKNNARVGALLALEYSKLENKTGAIIPPLEEAANRTGLVTNSLMTKNDDINDNSGSRKTTKVKEAVFERGRGGSFDDEDVCSKEHQLSDDGFGNSLRDEGQWQTLSDPKQIVNEKLPMIKEKRRSILNEELEENCDADIVGVQSSRQDIFGTTHSHKQTRQVDEAEQVLYKESESKCGREMKRKPVVIGCTMIDMHCSTKIDLLKNNPRYSGVTFAGKPHLTLGGVGRNLATALNFLGHEPTFITALADDTLGSLARTQLSKVGLRNNQLKVITCCHDDQLGEEKKQFSSDELSDQDREESCGTFKQASSCFALVLIDSADGQCEYVIADLECVKAINVAAIKTNLEAIKEAPLLVIDANLSAETIEYLVGICHKFGVPIFIEPTDKLALPNLVTCLKRVLHSNNPDILRSILCLSPNAIELKGILELFEDKQEEEEELGEGRENPVSDGQRQHQQPVRNNCLYFTRTNIKQSFSTLDEQKKGIGDSNNHEKSSEKQMTLEQIEQMATRLMHIHLPQIKCLLVTMDQRGVLVALRSNSGSNTSSIRDKKGLCKERAKFSGSSSNNIESVKLMVEIGGPLSEKIHLKHFKPLKTIKQPISASGAGDSFAAGFISGLLSSQNLEECLEKAFKSSQLALQDKDTISSKLKTLSSSSANNC